MTSDGVDLESPSPNFTTLSIALTEGQDGELLRHPAIDIVWRWPCLPRFRLLRPLAIAVSLVVFKSWLVP